MKNEEKMMAMLETLLTKVSSIEHDVSGLKQGQAKLEQGQARIEADLAAIKKQQSIDSDSLDNIYMVVNDLRANYEAHSHDAKTLKISGVVGS